MVQLQGDDAAPGKKRHPGKYASALPPCGEEISEDPCEYGGAGGACSKEKPPVRSARAEQQQQ